jgi:transposase
LDIGRGHLGWPDTKKGGARCVLHGTWSAKELSDTGLCDGHVGPIHLASVHENTHAAIVFDLFHVARKITETVDKVRRQEFANADVATRKKYKKKRFLILKRGKRLDDESRESLTTLMTENERLYQAYLLKEQALDIFDERDEATALNRLDKWFENVKEAGISQFDAVVTTIKSYLYGIVNYFKYRLINAASEAFNNKIHIIKRRAYGFYDLDYFKLKRPSTNPLSAVTLKVNYWRET